MSPRWMLKSFFSSRIALNTSKCPKNGSACPGARVASVSPVYANLIVSFAFGFGAVVNLPVGLHTPEPQKR